MTFLSWIFPEVMGLNCLFRIVVGALDIPPRTGSLGSKLLRKAF